MRNNDMGSHLSDSYGRNGRYAGTLGGLGMVEDGPREQKPSKASVDEEGLRGFRKAEEHERKRKTMSQAAEIAAGAGTVALNVMTWSGMLDAMNGVQVFLTIGVSITMLVYYVYGIIEKHKTINGKQKPDQSDEP